MTCHISKYASNGRWLFSIETSELRRWLCCVVLHSSEKVNKEKWCNILCQLKLFSLRQLFGIALRGGRERIKRQEKIDSSHDMAMKNVFRIMNKTSTIDFHTGNSTTIYPFSRHNTKTKGKTSGMRMKNYRRQKRMNVVGSKSAQFRLGTHVCQHSWPYLVVLFVVLRLQQQCQNIENNDTRFGNFEFYSLSLLLPVVTYNYTSHFARMG